MVVPLTERRKGDNPMNETAERVEKAGDINEAYRLVYIYGKENPKDIDGLIALNKLLISKTGDRANNANDRNIIYEAYRSIARCYKNKNLLGSGYPYDAKNYEMAADYYLKAFDKAPDSGTKLSSLDGAASMFGIWTKCRIGVGYGCNRRNCFRIRIRPGFIWILRGKRQMVKRSAVIIGWH